MASRQALDPRTLRRIYDRAAKRYDVQHALLTAASDQKGRRLLVNQAVREGDRVLDAGAGTGSTALLAARKVGPRGRVVLLDLSPTMLAVARRRLEAAGLSDRAAYVVGDLHAPPFADASFDTVLSTYSLCPLMDPVRSALALYRLVRPGGRLGVAHSAEPDAPWLRKLAAGVEAMVWRFPAVSLGCRPISVLPALKQQGARVLFCRKTGVPLWPFQVFVVQKPA